MNLNNKYEKRLILLFAAFILFSCNKDNNYRNRVDSEKNKHFVTKNEIISITQNYKLNENYIQNTSAKKINNLISENDNKREILSIDQIEDNSRTLLYIVNYKNNKGFTILTADKRTIPIIASSEKGNFNMDFVSGGLEKWLIAQKIYVREAESIKTKEIESNSILWKDLSNNGYIGGEEPGKYEPEEPHTEVFNYGPLIKTKWRQGYGYNKYCKSFNGKLAPAGCVAIAIAQIMYYHQYPSKYNWDKMKPLEATDASAKLIREIGDAVNMEYSPYGSGAMTSDAPKALISNFGYSKDAYYTTFGQITAEREIKAGRPIIVRGQGKAGGHAWVCDGVRRTDVYANDDMEFYLAFNMNWGWGGENNGWFSYNNFKTKNGDYSIKPHMVINIHPNNN